MKKSTSANRPKKQRVATPLELKDREKLIALLNDPVMQRALGNIGALKPGVFFHGAGAALGEAKSAEMATLAANNRLCEMRGWEMFEAALYAQADDPKSAREQTEEEFKD